MPTYVRAEGLPRAPLRVCRRALLALLLSSVARPALAETSNAELLKRIESLEATIRQMRAAPPARPASEHRAKTRQPAAVPAPAPAPVSNLEPAMIPRGTAPAFVTSRKQLQFGSITITPGGFLAAEGIFRSRTITADVATPFFAIPTLNSAFAHTPELRLSARQSRAALLVQGTITPSLVASAYAELDFLGAAQTANQVESNSYNPRLRHIYATLDMQDSGWHLLAGQNWTLATLNSAGITPRNEVVPPTIDAYLVPGFVWLRQPQLRLVKDFDKKVWLALSLEQPQTTFPTGACTPGSYATHIGTPPNVAAAGITCQETGSTFFNPNSAFSLNRLPDVVGKVALEQRIGDRDVHLEAFGLYRDLYDRVAFADGGFAARHATGYGVGFGAVAPILPRRLDFEVSGLFGRGLGRYGTSQLPDATFGADGAPRPIRETMLLAGATAHLTPAIDAYVFAGLEKQAANYFQNGPIVSAGGAASGFYGVGVPNADDSGCYTEGSSACTGSTKAVYQVTAGIWDKLYAGGYGEVRVGAQYSYTKRDLFPSVYGGAAFRPHTDDNVVLTSLRYYPFQ